MSLPTYVKLELLSKINALHMHNIIFMGTGYYCIEVCSMWHLGQCYKQVDLGTFCQAGSKHVARMVRFARYIVLYLTRYTPRPSSLAWLYTLALYCTSNQYFEMINLCTFNSGKFCSCDSSFQLQILIQFKIIIFSLCNKVGLNYLFDKHTHVVVSLHAKRLWSKTWETWVGE